MSDPERPEEPAQSEPAPPKPAEAPTRTPMYKANHAPRYHRQTMIKQIGDATDATLLCYVCGKSARIDRDDTMGFVDLLHNVPSGSKIDLLLHTRGGDLDAAEKLISLVQTTVAGKRLRVIVPDMAKSAGTLMALGADTIVMSDSSELGTIDPQVLLGDGRGNDFWHSVLDYLDAYEQHAKALSLNRDDPVAQLMLDKIDPARVRKFEAVRARTRNMAEGLLKQKGKNYSQIASDLMDTKRWPSHGQMIKWQDLLQIGLTVEYIPQHDPRWRAYWDLYCLLRIAVTPTQKIFESHYAADIGVQYQVAPASKGLNNCPHERWREPCGIAVEVMGQSRNGTRIPGRVY